MNFHQHSAIDLPNLGHLHGGTSTLARNVAEEESVQGLMMCSVYTLLTKSPNV